MEISQAKDFKRFFIVGAPMTNDLSHPFLNRDIIIMLLRFTLTN